MTKNIELKDEINKLKNSFSNLLEFIDNIPDLNEYKENIGLQDYKNKLSKTYDEIEKFTVLNFLNLKNLKLIQNLIDKSKEILIKLKKLNTYIKNKSYDNIINTINGIKDSIKELSNFSGLSTNRYLLDYNFEPMIIIDIETNLYWELYFQKKVSYDSLSKIEGKRLIPDAKTWETLFDNKCQLANFIAEKTNFNIYDSLFWLIDYKNKENVGRFNLFGTGGYGPNKEGMLHLALFNSLSLNL